MSESVLNRREFLSRSAGAVAWVPVTAAMARVPGSNDKISVGVIGTGNRGRTALMPEVYRFSEQENVEITAVCDPWNEAREQAAAKVKEWYGREARQFVHYQDLLALKDVDAVLVACPDHQHCTVLKASVEAGKDVYQEKPIAMNLEELVAAYDAVKKHNRIVQLGTQLRSWPSFTGVRQVVQGGNLGKICKVEQVRNDPEPYWFRYAKDIKESDTDWKTFLMNKPYRPFDADQCTAWYGYRDFSSGPIGGFMSHFIDLVHYITDSRFPLRAVTMGGKYAFGDKRTCPDTIQTLLEYPEGFLVSYSSCLGNGSGSYTRFYGTRGVIDATNWSEPVMSGEGCKGPDRIEGEWPVPKVDMPHHMENWLQCLRSREQPNANIEAGYMHGVACILSDRAYVTGRAMMYDREKREIREA
ncbi:MAG: Gfo/Idh/MocA family oxidoreductase [bacterium]